MLGNEVLAALAAKPLEPELPKVAGLAAALAAVLSALDSLAQGEGLRQYLPILALVILVTLAVFAWAVPSALEKDEPAPSNTALALSGLGVITLLLFWTGLPLLLATGGLVLGQTQLDLPGERRRVAVAAIRVGCAAVVLCLLLFVADLL